MDESIKFFIGLDAHKDNIAVAACEAGREPSRFVGTLGPDVQGVLKTLRKYGPVPQVSVVYEAGSTGYGLHRVLSQRGYHCENIAPSSKAAAQSIRMTNRCTSSCKLSCTAPLYP